MMHKGNEKVRAISRLPLEVIEDTTVSNHSDLKSSPAMMRHCTLSASAVPPRRVCPGSAFYILFFPLAENRGLSPIIIVLGTKIIWPVGAHDIGPTGGCHSRRCARFCRALAFT